jgi:anti-sigma-K factor RskA
MSDAMRPATDLTCDDVRDLAGAFVLGALEPAEEAAVRAHLASCPDAHAEIAEVGAVLPMLDASVPQVVPPAALKTRLMAAAAADLAARDVAAPAGTPAAPATAAPTGSPAPPMATVLAFPSEGASTRRVSRPGSARTWAMRIAAVLVIGILGGWNVLLQGQLDQSRTYEANVAAVLELAGHDGSLTAILQPDEGTGPAGLAAVGADGTMAVAMHDLDPTKGDEVYEAWMIGSDGVPIALGGFKVGETGVAYFRGSGVPAEPGVILALTREPRAGATVPSSDPVSLGTIAG